METITPDRFLTVPMPGYASIRLAMAPRFGVRRMLDKAQPEIVHIATEGPIGWAARGWCLSRGVPFTSAFHTRFPEYAAVGFADSESDRKNKSGDPGTREKLTSKYQFDNTRRANAKIIHNRLSFRP